MTAGPRSGAQLAIDPADVAARLTEVRRRISSAGGDGRHIRIVAMTKGFGPDAVRAAAAAGVHDVGENYADELVAKHGQVTTAADSPAPPAASALALPAAGASGAPAANPNPNPDPNRPAPTEAQPPASTSPPAVSASRWHFLGRVQRNKVKRLAPLVHLWQTVDRYAAAEEIARRAPGARVLVQVNVSGEPQKNGCDLADTPELVDGLRSLDLDVVGLMTVGPAGPPEGARHGYRQLAVMADRLELSERSMGMTDDLEVAVEEGTTMVRVGRALFGSRSVPTDLRR